jgi:rhodanese-related sulfurtransferase
MTTEPSEPDDTGTALDPVVADEAILAGAFVLDVREPDEYQAGHIDGATNIPLGGLGGKVSEVPTDRVIVCVCRSGHRSGLAVRELRAAGLHAVNLVGGMGAWAKEGLPIISSSGGSGTVL